MDYPERVTSTDALLVADAKGVYRVLRCGWLVRVPSNNPEPDSFSDTFNDVPCGAIMRGIEGDHCDEGHTFGYTDASAANELYRELETGDDFDPWLSLSHVV